MNPFAMGQRKQNSLRDGSFVSTDGRPTGSYPETLYRMRPVIGRQVGREVVRGASDTAV